jgi:hypothetical protein
VQQISCSYLQCETIEKIHEVQILAPCNMPHPASIRSPSSRYGVGLTRSAHRHHWDVQERLNSEASKQHLLEIYLTLIYIIYNIYNNQSLLIIYHYCRSKAGINGQVLIPTFSGEGLRPLGAMRPVIGKSTIDWDRQKRVFKPWFMNVL